MLVSHWHSGSVPEAGQFGFARDLLLSTPVPVRMERPGIDQETGFRSATWLHAWGPDIVAGRSIGQAATGIRGRAEIARGAPSCVWILQYRDSVGEMRLDGRPYHVEAGDVLYGNCGVEQFGHGSAHVDFTMWMLPAGWLTPMLADPADDPCGIVRHKGPFGRLVADYMHNLPTALDAVAPPDAERLVGNLLAMLAMSRGLSSHHEEPAAASLDDARLMAVRRDITQLWADPALTPAVLAARHRLSLRALHLLFEPTGTTCARTILETRLTAAHAQLSSAAHRQRSIADIAFGCGFESLSTFHRNFRARYGHTPADTRDG